LAEVKAALIQNVDEPARNPFSEDFKVQADNNGCFSFSSNDCSFVGDTVPAGKRLVITNITGSLLTVNPPEVYTNLFTNNGQAARVNLPATIQYYGNVFGQDQYWVNFNLQLQSYLEAGQQIGFEINVGNATFVDGPYVVRISGYYVNL
jgi:hypothetical protein